MWVLMKFYKGSLFGINRVLTAIAKNETLITRQTKSDRLEAHFTYPYVN